MPRITVKTAWPKGAPQSEVLKEARYAAIDQVPFQVVESHTEPQVANIPDPANPGKEIPSPNDDSVDRFLITQWDYTK